MELIRKQTYITREQDVAVKTLAQRYHTTEAEILRRALDSWLQRERRGQSDDPFERLVGLFEGPTEVNHDDIYR
jgi:hypothetical protein